MPPPDNRSIGDLVAQLSRETGVLVRKEVELAKTELSAKVRHAGTHVATTAAGGALAPRHVRPRRVLPAPTGPRPPRDSTGAHERRSQGGRPAAAFLTDPPHCAAAARRRRRSRTNRGAPHDRRCATRRSVRPAA